MYSHFGAAKKAQAGIIGVRYSYIGGKFSWYCKDPSYCADPQVYSGAPTDATRIGAAVKPFRIRSSVSFVKVNNAAKLFVPPAPQLINPLPADVWYPFNIPT